MSEQLMHKGIELAVADPLLTHIADETCKSPI